MKSVVEIISLARRFGPGDEIYLPSIDPSQPELNIDFAVPEPDDAIPVGAVRIGVLWVTDANIWGDGCPVSASFFVTRKHGDSFEASHWIPNSVSFGTGVHFLVPDIIWADDAIDADPSVFSLATMLREQLETFLVKWDGFIRERHLPVALSMVEQGESLLMADA